MIETVCYVKVKQDDEGWGFEIKWHDGDTIGFEGCDTRERALANADRFILEKIKATIGNRA